MYCGARSSITDRWYHNPMIVCRSSDDVTSHCRASWALPWGGIEHCQLTFPSLPRDSGSCSSVPSHCAFTPSPVEITDIEEPLLGLLSAGAISFTVRFGSSEMGIWSTTLILIGIALLLNTVIRWVQFLEFTCFQYAPE